MKPLKLKQALLLKEEVNEQDYIYTKQEITEKLREALKEYNAAKQMSDIPRENLVTYEKNVELRKNMLKLCDDKGITYLNYGLAGKGIYN